MRARKGVDQLPWNRVSYKVLLGSQVAVPAFVQWFLGFPWWFFPFTFALLFLPVFAVFMFVFNQICLGDTLTCNIERFIEFRDESLAEKYRNRKIPMRELYEAYADGKLDFKMDILEAFEHREQFTSFELQFYHIKFFVCTFLPELIWHSKAQDREQVCGHYDRGNDFYEGFLGPMMIYTSGIIRKKEESLEEMQTNKLRIVCDKIQLKERERHLDIGCGWGTLVNYAAEVCGSQSTGVSIAKNQIEWGRNVAAKKKQESRAKFLCLDYRDIPPTKYDKITCLEMAEHVGVRKFQTFLVQVREMLEDNGVFFLQIAGLRQAWQWEDFIWGLFMDQYIFPGADASCPLNWVVYQLELAGFEVQGVETIGVHYSRTINHWYNNWMRPDTQKTMCERYGRTAKIWNIFLAWSTIIARQGNSTCYQLVCHKNLNQYDRTKFFQGESVAVSLKQY